MNLFKQKYYERKYLKYKKKYLLLYGGSKLTDNIQSRINELNEELKRILKTNESSKHNNATLANNEIMDINSSPTISDKSVISNNSSVEDNKIIDINSYEEAFYKLNEIKTCKELIMESKNLTIPQFLKVIEKTELPSIIIDNYKWELIMFIIPNDYPYINNSYINDAPADYNDKMAQPRVLLKRTDINNSNNLNNFIHLGAIVSASNICFWRLLIKSSLNTSASLKYGHYVLGLLLHNKLQKFIEENKFNTNIVKNDITCTNFLDSFSFESTNKVLEEINDKTRIICNDNIFNILNDLCKKNTIFSCGFSNLLGTLKNIKNEYIEYLQKEENKHLITEVNKFSELETYDYLIFIIKNMINNTELTKSFLEQSEYSSISIFFEKLTSLIKENNLLSEEDYSYYSGNKIFSDYIFIYDIILRYIKKNLVKYNDNKINNYTIVDDFNGLVRNIEVYEKEYIIREILENNKEVENKHIYIANYLSFTYFPTNERYTVLQYIIPKIHSEMTDVGLYPCFLNGGYVFCKPIDYKKNLDSYFTDEIIRNEDYQDIIIGDDFYYFILPFLNQKNLLGEL